MDNASVCLRGNTLVLVPYLPHHVKRYHEWMTDPELLALTCSEPLSFDEEVENQQSWLDSDDKLTFIILRRGAGATSSDDGRLEMLGDCNAFMSSQDEDEAEVEVSLSEAAYRRLGVAQEAVKLLMVYVARQVFGRRKMIAKILTHNTASIDLFTNRLGFEHFRDLKVFDESHFRRTFADDAAVEALAAECGYVHETYLLPPSITANTNGGTRGSAVGDIGAADTDADASEGAAFAYLWQTWAERAAAVAQRSDLLRHSAASETRIDARGIIAEKAELFAKQPDDLCGLVSAEIDGATVTVAHSSNPNALYVHNKLVALRTILPGEAILVNVNASVSEPLRYPFPDRPFTAFWDEHQSASAGFGIGDGYVVPAVAEAKTEADAAEEEEEEEDSVAAQAAFAPKVLVGRGLSPAIQPAWYIDRWMRYADAPVRRLTYERDAYVPASNAPGLVEVREAAVGGMATYAASLIPSGTTIWDIAGVALPFPTVFTLSVAPGVNVLFSCDAQCLAHSCEPNAVIVTEDAAVSRGEPAFRVVAVRDIAEGEVISFDYLTTEWAMDEPFDCSCGAASCRGSIQGFKFLDTAAQQELLPKVLPGVRARFTGTC